MLTRSAAQLQQCKQRLSGSLALHLQQQTGFAKKGQGQEQDTQLQKIVEFLTPQEVKPLDLTPEEQREWEGRAKEYSRLKMAEHRAWQKALSIKLKLKQAAIRALPLELRVEAEKDDDALPPMNRNMFTHTPPIPGYMDRRQEDTRQRSGRKIGTR